MSTIRQIMFYVWVEVGRSKRGRRSKASNVRFFGGKRFSSCHCHSFIRVPRRPPPSYLSLLASNTTHNLYIQHPSYPINDELLLIPNSTTCGSADSQRAWQIPVHFFALYSEYESSSTKSILFTTSSCSETIHPSTKNAAAHCRPT